MRVSPSAAITCLAIFLLATTNAFGGEPVRRIEVIITDLRPLPFELKGYLRQPEGLAQYPAVILVPACNQLYPSVEQFWGDLIASWGYVTLTLDSFGSRGIKDDCLLPAPLELAQDAYRALSFLGKKSFVDAKSVILVGFGQGGTLILSAIDTDGIARDAKRTFVAAAAFYPYCGAFNGKFAVQTWIVVGELDTWTTADFVDGWQKAAMTPVSLGQKAAVEQSNLLSYRTGTISLT